MQKENDRILKKVVEEILEKDKQNKKGTSPSFIRYVVHDGNFQSNSIFWKTEDEQVAELKEKGFDDTGRPVIDLDGLRWGANTNHANILDSHDVLRS